MAWEESPDVTREEACCGEGSAGAAWLEERESVRNMSSAPDPGERHVALCRGSERGEEALCALLWNLASYSWRSAISRCFLLLGKLRRVIRVPIVRLWLHWCSAWCIVKSNDVRHAIYEWYK